MDFLNLLALFAAAAAGGGGGDLTAVGAQACDRDGEENCPAYERAELLLAYEIMSLINGLQPHYDSASAGL